MRASCFVLLVLASLGCASASPGAEHERRAPLDPPALPPPLDASIDGASAYACAGAMSEGGRWVALRAAAFAGVEDVWDLGASPPRLALRVACDCEISLDERDRAWVFERGRALLHVVPLDPKLGEDAVLTIPEAAAWSRSGDRILVASGARARVLEWPTLRVERDATFPVDLTESVGPVRLLREGRGAIVQASLIDLERPALLGVGPVEAISDDGRFLAMCDARDVLVAETSTGRVTGRFDVSGTDLCKTSHVGFTPDGRYLLGASGEAPDASLLVFATETGAMRIEKRSELEWARGQVFVQAGSPAVVCVRLKENRSVTACPFAIDALGQVVEAPAQPEFAPPRPGRDVLESLADATTLVQLEYTPTDETSIETAHGDHLHVVAWDRSRAQLRVDVEIAPGPIEYTRRPPSVHGGREVAPSFEFLDAEHVFVQPRGTGMGSGVLDLAEGRFEPRRAATVLAGKLGTVDGRLTDLTTGVAIEDLLAARTLDFR